MEAGHGENDNGVLLLVAVDDHKMRIEVGQGLEGVLTDATSNRIIRDEMAPQFRSSNYDAGVTAGVNAIIGAIGGEYGADGSSDLSWGEKLMIGGMIFFLLGTFTFTAVTTDGCFGWGLYVFLIPFYAFFPWIVVGGTVSTALLILYLIGVPIIKIMLNRSPKWQAKRALAVAAGGSGGTSSSWSSWSSGGGGGGGSSFSGGGGSFGGGGSSGSW